VEVECAGSRVGVSEAHADKNIIRGGVVEVVRDNRYAVAGYSALQIGERLAIHPHLTIFSGG